MKRRSSLGLLALLLHVEARRPAQFDAAGRFVPLAKQDPEAWDAALTAEAEQAWVDEIVSNAGMRKGFMDVWLQDPTFAQAPLEPQAQGTKPLRKLTSQDKTAVFEFAYDGTLVQAIKAIRGSHRGEQFRSTYNAQARTWSVPVNETSIAQIMQVATAHDFDIEQRFTDYQAKVQVRKQAVEEALQEDRVMLALNDGVNVAVAHDAIVIAVENPEIMAEFQQALGV
mgnify:CR=1 FL=1